MEKLGTHKLIYTSPGPRIMVSLPTGLSAALREDGYTAADISLTDDGILLTPVRRDKNALTLPSWNNDE